MQTITCDVCKKKVEDPQTGRNFFYFADYNVCEPCRDEFELQMKEDIRAQDPFSYEWYNQHVADSLGKSVQKGKK